MTNSCRFFSASKFSFFFIEVLFIIQIIPYAQKFIQKRDLAYPFRDPKYSTMRERIIRSRILDMKGLDVKIYFITAMFKKTNNLENSNGHDVSRIYT